MHMADALLSPSVGLAMNAVSIAAIGVSVAKVKKYDLSEKMVPIMGVAGALVFAGQMINFTIPGTGSSGHIGGGILLAGLLGGVPAFLSIAAVLIIQCLFFADGGLLALGSNIFVMGVIPCLVMYPLIFKPLLKNGTSYKRLTVASIVSVMTGLELGAFGVVLLTLLSGITALPFGTFAALMLPIHLAIGLVEGIVTAAVLCFIYKMRPEILDTTRSSERLSGVSVKKIVIILAICAVVVGAGLSLFVSQNPDGLEWSIAKTTEQSGTGDDLHANLQEDIAILPDYKYPSLSGIIGGAVTFALAGAAGIVITKMKKGKKVAQDG